MRSYGRNVYGEAIPKKWQQGKPPQAQSNESSPQKNLVFPPGAAMIAIPPAKKAPVEPSSWRFAPGPHRPGAFFARGPVPFQQQELSLRSISCNFGLALQQIRMLD
jgi:hypothetical protein